VLLLNKIDLLPAEETSALEVYLRERTPGVPVLPVSALTKHGLDAWMDRLEVALDGRDVTPGAHGTPGAAEHQDAPGSRVLGLDYDRYADAEAALGWLNAEGRVTSEGGDYGEQWALTALTALAELARAAGSEVAHAKLRLDAAGGSCVANLVESTALPFVRVEGRVEGVATLVLNARVAATPERVRAWVEEALTKADARAKTLTSLTDVRCFAPARPVPTYRLEPA